MFSAKQQGYAYEHKPLIKEAVDDAYRPVSAAGVNLCLCFAYVAECQRNPDPTGKWLQMITLNNSKRRVLREWNFSPQKDLYFR